VLADIASSCALTIDRSSAWSCNGGVCTGEVYNSAVKLTFFKGASLANPAALFTFSLDGKVRRAVDIKHGQVVDEAALADLVRAAVALNAMG